MRPLYVIKINGYLYGINRKVNNQINCEFNSIEDNKYCTYIYK